MTQQENTNMIDLFLRAETETALIEACPFLRGVDDNGNPIWVTGTLDYALSIIGPVVGTPGDYDDDGVEVTPPVMDDRFHANLRCLPSIANQVPSEVVVDPDPADPVREWA